MLAATGRGEQSGKGSSGEETSKSWESWDKGMAETEPEPEPAATADGVQVSLLR